MPDGKFAVKILKKLEKKVKIMTEKDFTEELSISEKRQSDRKKLIVDVNFKLILIILLSQGKKARKLLFSYNHNSRYTVVPYVWLRNIYFNC